MIIIIFTFNTDSIFGFDINSISERNGQYHYEKALQISKTTKFSVCSWFYPMRYFKEHNRIFFMIMDKVTDTSKINPVFAILAIYCKLA